MPPFALLLGAIVIEVIATSSLKLSEGFTKPLPTIVSLVGYGIAFYLLSLTLKHIPVGVSYAIWSGLGTFGIVVIGILFWNESLDAPRVLGIVLIIVGVVVLNVFSPASNPA